MKGFEQTYININDCNIYGKDIFMIFSSTCMTLGTISGLIIAWWKCGEVSVKVWRASIHPIGISDTVRIREIQYALGRGTTGFKLVSAVHGAR